MSSFDTISMCARNLVKRKLRTFLTLLGVIIGTASIILMISFGLATDAMFNQMIEDMAIDMTQVDVHPSWDGQRWCDETNGWIDSVRRDITDNSIAAISQIPGVLVATPLVRENVILRSGPYSMRASVTGILPEALALMGYNLAAGRMLEADEGFAVVLGAQAELNFFDHREHPMAWEGPRVWDYMMGHDVDTYVDVFNDPIRLYYDDAVLPSPFRFFVGGGMGGGVVMMEGGGGGGDDDFGMDMEDAFRVFRSFDVDVVGVLEYQPDPWGWGMNWDNLVIYMDINTLHNLSQLRNEAQVRAQQENEFNPVFNASPGGARTTYDRLFVLAETIDDVQDVARAIRDMGYNPHFQGGWIESQRRGQQAVQTLLAVIAAISLIVAAINIANTMITSVTERTREIGIMKVIGASLMDVRKLFLTEAIVIGALGGLLGIGLAFFGSYALNNFDIAFLERLNMAPPITTEGMEDAPISLITTWLVGVALAVASGIGLVSGIFPAWHATRLSALAAIRNE